MIEDQGLDGVDLKILSELQKDGRIRNNELASRVGISPPPCLRRVRSLLRRGVIRAIRATLDERHLGYEVISFVSIQLKRQTPAAIDAFEAAIMAEPRVQQCWRLSGDTDFLLKCLAPNVEAMHRQLLRFAGMPEVLAIRSFPVLGLSKDEPLPIPEDPPTALPK
ncbi:MAG TPA: Lrp/AsnC family transcriptional regulator [Bradyrhizobium sp.]|uniref:Lrp/AsnC family transcriptional regulator n=1 Tax=Bradyrhizobium sp. TaxID=376 RepID=UPI002CB33FC3|nr:Lrp/AsnC family transcriptional regulator [Bradyrhizobium sp.]HLZ03623.1 Lrp/AsnC family transcriptional regulator [Bradyrhizobium sp.]